MIHVLNLLKTFVFFFIIPNIKCRTFKRSANLIQLCFFLDGVGGASDDWAKTVAGIKYTFTLELRPCANCVGGFVLAQSKIIPTAKETWAGVMAAANKIDEHLRTGGIKTFFSFNLDSKVFS